MRRRYLNKLALSATAIIMLIAVCAHSQCYCAGYFGHHFMIAWGTGNISLSYADYEKSKLDYSYHARQGFVLQRLADQSIWLWLGTSNSPLFIVDDIETLSTATVVGKDYYLSIPVWYFVLGFLILTLRYAFLLRRYHRRLRNGLCPICAYDLRVSTRCPECDFQPTVSIKT